MNPLSTQAPDKTYAFVWDGVLLFAPAQIKNRRHAHFAATLLIAVNKPFALTLDGVGKRHYEMALLGPNMPRQLDSQGEPLIDLLIDADDPAYRYLVPHLAAQPFVPLQQTLIAPVRPLFKDLLNGGLDCQGAAHLVATLLAQLTPDCPAQLPWDPRILAAAAYMRQRLQVALPSIAEVGAQVGLSASRLRHLFREELGLPVRQYLLWMRIRHAMRLWAQGCSSVEIAHGAGFYDQAHFSKTLRKMTDYAPSMLADNPQVIARAC